MCVLPKAGQKLRRRRELPTKRLLRPIAKAATIGLRCPERATPIPRMLYPTAQKRFRLIVVTVRRANRNVKATVSRLFPSRHTSAASRDKSAPQPMAMPTSAVASAGASFKPSSTIAMGSTCCPRDSTQDTFALGDRAADVGMSSRLAMACARAAESPDGAITCKHSAGVARNPKGVNDTHPLFMSPWYS